MKSDESFASRWRVWRASSIEALMPHSQAWRMMLEASAIEVHFSSRCLNLKATASSMVSPSKTASTMAISASGVHCSVQRSAQVVPSWPHGDLLGEGDFQHGQPMEKAGAMQIEKRGLRALDAAILAQVEVQVALHGGLELLQLEPVNSR